MSSPDDAVLGLPRHRLVFSTVKSAATPARTFTFTNTGNAPATVTGLAIQGADASSFSLAPGQPTCLTIPAGGSATVSVAFTPTAATHCPTGTAYPDAYDIGDSVRQAQPWSSPPTTRVLPGGNGGLGGINSCDDSGNNEPVLDQVLRRSATPTSSTGRDRPPLHRSAVHPRHRRGHGALLPRRRPGAAGQRLPRCAHYSTDTPPAVPRDGLVLAGRGAGPDGYLQRELPPGLGVPGRGPARTCSTRTSGCCRSPTGPRPSPRPATSGSTWVSSRDVNFTDDTLNIATSAAPTTADSCRSQTCTTCGSTRRTGPATWRSRTPTSWRSTSPGCRPYKNNDFQDVVLMVSQRGPRRRPAVLPTLSWGRHLAVAAPSAVRAHDPPRHVRPRRGAPSSQPARTSESQCAPR